MHALDVVDFAVVRTTSTKKMPVVLHITPSERAALQLLALGLPPRLVAGELGVCEDEVEAELAMLFVRMGVTGQRAALADARRRGLIIT